MAKLNGDWFRKKLVEKHKSQRALAKYLGLDPGAITLTFDGKRRLQMDEARQIAVFLGESVTDVLRAAGMPLEGQSAPIAPAFQAQANGDIVQMMQEKRAELARQIEALDAAIAIMAPQKK